MSILTFRMSQLKESTSFPGSAWERNPRCGRAATTQHAQAEPGHEKDTKFTD